LSDENQLIIYDLIKKSSDKATEITLEIFDKLNTWLSRPAILTQRDAQRSMRKAIKPILSKNEIDIKLSKEIVSKLVEKFA